LPVDIGRMPMLHQNQDLVQPLRGFSARKSHVGIKVTKT